MRNLKAVIFDLDGLLVDSEPVWFKVRTEMFGRYGMTWTHDDQKALMGRNTQSWIDYVHDKLGGKLSKREVETQTVEAMAGSYRKHEVRIMPGAEIALEQSSKQFIVGLASGSPYVLIEAALKANGWAKYFSRILSSDDVPQGKPSPDVYVEIMKRMGVQPYESVVVEDSGSGILAGKAAGALVIAIPNERLMPAKEALDSANIVIRSLEAFSEAIGKLRA